MHDTEAGGVRHRYPNPQPKTKLLRREGYCCVCFQSTANKGPEMKQASGIWSTHRVADEEQRWICFLQSSVDIKHGVQEGRGSDVALPNNEANTDKREHASKRVGRKTANWMGGPRGQHARGVGRTRRFCMP